ncbi:uncharacterized protein LOC130645866 [Hydractinia symbiolongicarpus]|uniref:uncharacterized protein LOC130645866 n=1 Tax=Hydractinia symbiolongicarpus TaxID=13093 RepID=UPI00254F895A|nr:uncharacterized protein LOC130645866 [Hydractinia symbiolongicarpus]
MNSVTSDVSFSFFADNRFEDSPTEEEIALYSPSCQLLFNDCSVNRKQNLDDVARKLFAHLPTETFIGKSSRRNNKKKTSFFSTDQYLIPEPPEERFTQFTSPATASNNEPGDLSHSSDNRNLPMLNYLNSELELDIKEELMSPFVSAVQNSRISYKPMKCPENEVEDLLCDWARHINLSATLDKQCAPLDEEQQEVLPVYEMTIPIDVHELLNFNSMLGNLILTSPLTFLNHLKQVCYNIVKGNDMLMKLYSPYQVVIKPNFMSVPTTKETTVESSRCIANMKRNHGKLFKVRGLVIGLSSNVPYTKSAEYRCLQEDCIWFGEHCYLITSAVGSVEADVVRTDFQCDGCGNFLVEDISKRTFADKIYCFVIPKEAAKNLRCINNINNHRSQAIKMLLKDDMCKSIHIGGYFWFTGVYKNDVLLSSQLSVQNLFEVLNVEPDVPFINKVKSFQKLLPDPVCTLYQDRKTSPWSFASSLVYTFLDTVYPAGMFHLFKTVILFSLVMEGDKSILNIEGKDEIKNTNNNLHVLVEDKEILAYQRQMLYAISYSESSVVHRVPLYLFGAVNDDGSVVYVDGGTLSLASTGICVIPNITELKKNTIEQLQKACESEAITINIPRKQHEEVQQSQFVLPFKSSVWCCCENSFDISHKETVPSAFLSQLHLVLSNRTQNKWNNFDEVLSANILGKASKPTQQYTGTLITHSHMMEVISRVRSHTVEMSLEAYKFIKTFYLVSRRVNSHVTHITLQTLLRLSAAHTKLMLHKKVSVDDAVVSIHILEQLMALKYGDSILGVTPVLHFENKDMSRFIGPENDLFLRQLKRHIVQYCSSYYPDALSDVLLDEE